MNTGTIVNLLIREEGEVLHAYQDSEDFWTIGVGHLIDKRKGGKISKKISRLILEDDIASSVAAAEKYAWFCGLNDARQAIVVSMIFQLGVGGFRAFKKTRAFLAAGEFDKAAVEMLDSAWARQAPARAKRASKVIRTGEMA